MTLAASEEFENRRKALASALSVLNDGSGASSRRAGSPKKPITLEELADEFGVSRERVRQISERAFEKVQNAVKHRVARWGARRLCRCVRLPTLSRSGRS